MVFESQTSGGWGYCHFDSSPFPLLFRERTSQLATTWNFFTFLFINVMMGGIRLSWRYIKVRRTCLMLFCIAIGQFKCSPLHKIECITTTAAALKLFPGLNFTLTFSILLSHWRSGRHELHGIRRMVFDRFLVCVRLHRRISCRYGGSDIHCGYNVQKRVFLTETWLTFSLNLPVGGP